MSNITSNDLFIGKEQIFRDVIRLAENWMLRMESSGFEGGTLLEIHEFRKTPEGQKIDAAHDALSDYFSTLGFDDVKMLQTVMYLGRDKDYDKSLSPVEIYNDFLGYLGRRGWNSKETETNQILEKGPLARYLISGLKILDVQL